MKAFTSPVLLVALLLPTISFANNSAAQIEHITVTYRTPLEYATYQYTTNMLRHFNQLILSDIQQQAKESSMQMAREQGIIIDKIVTAIEPSKTLVNTRIFESAE